GGLWVRQADTAHGGGEDAVTGRQVERLCDSVDYAMGTPGHMAPEMLMTGEISAATDVYSFGVVLLQLVTGRLPIDANRQQLTLWAPPLLEEERWEELVDPRLQRALLARATGGGAGGAGGGRGGEDGAGAGAVGGAVEELRRLVAGRSVGAVSAAGGHSRLRGQQGLPRPDSKGTGQRGTRALDDSARPVYMDQQLGMMLGPQCMQGCMQGGTQPCLLAQHGGDSEHDQAEPGARASHTPPQHAMCAVPRTHVLALCAHALAVVGCSVCAAE
ncbi:unnamed protein product, partial [Closterium sp. Yama58-4]